MVMKRELTGGELMRPRNQSIGLIDGRAQCQTTTGQGHENAGVEVMKTEIVTVIGTNEIFHPTAFDITFTFTPVSGPSQSFTDTSSRPNQTGNLTCQISGSQTDPL